jgi:hypothetical protein
LDESCKGRFNILPFLKLPEEIYEELENQTINLKENLKFNTKDKILIQQNIEVYRRISTNNFFVFKKIFSLLKENSSELEVDLLFLMKMIVYTMNYSCQNSITASEIEEILNFLNTRKFTKDQLKVIFNTVLELNQIKFIIDSFENVSIFNNTIMNTVNKIVSFKVNFFDEFKKTFNYFLEESPIFYEKFKILKVKKIIIENLEEESFQEIYESLIKKV